MLHHVFDSHTSQSWHHKYEIARCMHLAGYLTQLSLCIPANGSSLQVLHSVLPFFLGCAPLYTTNPKPSIDWPTAGIVLSTDVNLLIFAILLWLLKTRASAYLLQD